MRVTYEDKIFELTEYIKVNELLKNELNDKYIACIVNNQVHALDYELRDNSEVELIDCTVKEGRAVYIRGIMYIMGMAFSELYPEALLSVNFQLHNSMFCQIDNMELTDEMIQRVKERMKKIVELKLPITKTLMTVDEAKAFYA